MDPKPEEFEKMAKMEDVFEWAGFDKTTMADDKTPAGSLAIMLGIKPNTVSRVVGVFSDVDYMAALQQWKV